MRSSRNWKNPRILLMSVAVMGLFAASASCSKEKGKERQMFLVVDSSGSMAEGKVSTMNRVQETLPSLMKTVEPGDRLSLLTFSEKPTLIGEFVIESDVEKKRVVDAVNNLKPTGRYTDMQAMLANLAELARKQSANASRQYLIVLTDGIDDPSPDVKKKRKLLALEAYRTKEEVPLKERYIYYVNLGDKSDPTLKAGLESLSSNVEVIDGNAEGGSLTGVAGKIKNLEHKALMDKINSYSGYYPLIGYILAGLAGIVLLILLIRRMARGEMLEGKLFYREVGTPRSVNNEYSLNKVKKRKMTIGSRTGVNLKIRDLGAPGIVTLKGGKNSGNVGVRPIGGNRFLVNLLDRNRPGWTILNGDKFKIGNYLFEYSNAPEKRK